MDIYPLLHLDNLLDKLIHACFLSAINLASGYHCGYTLLKMLRRKQHLQLDMVCLNTLYYH